MDARKKRDGRSVVQNRARTDGESRLPRRNAGKNAKCLAPWDTVQRKREEQQEEEVHLTERQRNREKVDKVRKIRTV